MKLYLPLFAIILILTTLNCVSPAPISKLKPLSTENYVWQNGREVITKKQGALSVELSYKNKSEGLFVFDITLVNESDTDILIDPSRFYYVPVDESGDSLTLVMAEDPENRILDQEIHLSRLDANHSNQLLSSVIWGAVQATTELADNNYESDENEYSMYDHHQEQLAEIDFDKWNASEQKNYWETQTIRKTTLFPEYYITGQFLIRYHKKAKKVLIVIPVGEQQFTFEFNHFQISAK